MPRSRSRSPPPRPSNSTSNSYRSNRSPPRGGGDRDRGYTAADREREAAGNRRKYDERSDRDRRGGGGESGSGRRDAREGGPVMKEPSPPPAAKEAAKPNFGLSGALAAETNTNAAGVTLKYNEPPEARKPSLNWRLYVFKGKDQVDIFHIHRQSAYLAGRDAATVDIPIAHPSCSKQHAVIQFRLIRHRNEFGDESVAVKPFIIDLDSTNGTFVNDKEIPASRYYELKASDVLKFGQSTREYVLLHEEAA
ncbi:SMAD/FHA domain-containing protein [Mrakia frigida]|uniref:Pml1p n=1 Tax=Mrakia frigida TaxID=29902 RepID=UPI003FCC0E9D